MSNRGRLFVLSAPSGSGKTSLANRLLELVDNLEFSVSYTTRSRRGAERDGFEYFFVDVAEFEAMIERQEFLEYEHVYGNYYGTNRRFVESRLEEGTDILLDIDIKGARMVVEQMPAAVRIFVLPPSYKVLRERLVGRGLDDPDIVECRLRAARQEIVSVKDYDYVIINNDIERSVRDLRTVVEGPASEAERFAGSRCKEIDRICRTFIPDTEVGKD